MSNLLPRFFNASNSPVAGKSLRYVSGDNISWEDAPNYTGFENTTDSTISFNNSTRVFTIAPTTISFNCFFSGYKKTFNSSNTVTIPNTLGIHFIYFDTDFVLKTSMTPWSVLTNNQCFVATVEWNGSVGDFTEERHSSKRNAIWHYNNHTLFGAQYLTGLTATNNGGTGTGATFSISSGVVVDEDLNNAISTTTSARTFYQTGASTYIFDSILSAIPFKAGANNRPCYVRSDTYALVEMTSAINRYINVFVYAIGSLSCGIRFFTETVSATTAGTNGYTSIANARAIPFPNLSGLGMSPEMKAIYRFIVRADGQIQAIDTTLDDYRKVTSLPQAAGNVSTTASTVTFVPTGNISTTTVQSAVSELDTNNEYYASTEASNTITLNLTSKQWKSFFCTISDTNAKTMSLSNVPAGNVEIFLRLKFTSLAAITWFSGITWLDAITPIFVSGKTYRLAFYSEDGGSSWQGMYTGAW